MTLWQTLSGALRRARRRQAEGPVDEELLESSAEEAVDLRSDDMRNLEREGDPRGGPQSPEYRTADPRDVVVEGDVAMGGPGGSPQEREPELRGEPEGES